MLKELTMIIYDPNTLRLTSEARNAGIKLNKRKNE